MDMLISILANMISSVLAVLGLTIPVEVGGTLGRALLPKLLRVVLYTTPTDGTEPVPIYTDIQRAFARLCLVLRTYRDVPVGKEFADARLEALHQVQFQASLYSRTCFQVALWKIRDVVNARDAECTSSGFFVGRPMANLTAQVPTSSCKGKMTNYEAWLIATAALSPKKKTFLFGVSKLRSWEVGLSKRAAAKLGVKDTQKCLLGRFPNTRTLVVVVRIMEGLGDNCIGLPVGDLSNSKLKVRDMPTLLGGDADGDTYTLTAFHLPVRSRWSCREDYEWMKSQIEECLAEIEEAFTKFWEGVPEYPDPTCSNYTWKDEAADDPMSDAAMFYSKVMQKLAIGVVTNTILCLVIAKNMKSWLFGQISWADIRDLADRAIETVMDMKKGLGRNPMLISQLLMGATSFDEEAQEELQASGVSVKMMAALLRILTTDRGDAINVRTWAKYNKPMAAMLGSREAFESFAHNFLHVQKKDPEEFAQYFSDVLYGYEKSPYIKGTEGAMSFPIVRQSGAAKDPALQMRIMTLNREKRIKSITTLDMEGTCSTTNYNTSGDAVLLHCELDTACGKLYAGFKLESEGLVLPLKKGKILLRDTVYVPYEVKGQNMEITTGKACMLTTWGEVLTALAFANFEFPIKNLKGATDREEATERFRKMMEKILNRLLAAYEIINDDVCSYATAAGQTMIVNLATSLPTISKEKRAWMREHNITPAITNPVALCAERCMKASEFLLGEDRVAAMCDTISGKPGMAFYGIVEDGLTFVMLQAPLHHFQSNSQRPKLNAAANLQPFEGEIPPVYSTKGHPYAPSHPVWAVALPISLMDSFMLSDALSDVFRVKVFQPSVGAYKVYPLEDGQKFQASDGSDLKGVGCLTSYHEMPWLKFADGTRVRSEVVFNMGSKSHRLLRLTHFNMVIAAIAKLMSPGMEIPEGLTSSDIVARATASGLYANDDLTVEVLSPDKQTVLGRYPAGIIHLGMHRQIPSVVTSIHSQEEFEEDGYGNSTEAAGVKTGLMGYLTMQAAGLSKCCRVLHMDTPPARAAEIAAMITAAEYRKDPGTTGPTGNKEADEMRSRLNSH